MRTTTPTEAPGLFELLRHRIGEVMALDDTVLEPLLVALVAGGHALIEGVPGTGKTLLARTLARSVDCTFHRVQFTNDLMPSDVVGSMVWRPKEESFAFVRGPLFAHVVLADEINRTSPRTLSCLLEAMEAGTVSVEGRTVRLPHPFLVLATRNPIEFHGTFPVPEAALDRFLVRVALDYPQPERELALYLGRDPTRVLDELTPVLDRDALCGLQQQVDTVTVREPVARYAQTLVQATREHGEIALGASPRAAMAWLRAGRARALLHGRQHVLPDDLKALAVPVLAHRVFGNGSRPTAALIEALLQQLPVEL